MSWYNPLDWLDWLSDKISDALAKVGNGLDWAFDQAAMTTIPL